MLSPSRLFSFEGCPSASAKPANQSMIVGAPKEKKKKAKRLVEVWMLG